MMSNVGHPLFFSVGFSLIQKNALFTQITKQMVYNIGHTPFLAFVTEKQVVSAR